MALVSFDLDGVLQQNAFRSGRSDGIFGHITRELAPYVQGDPQEATGAALRLVIGRHKARLSAGALVEAYDWDGIVAEVAAELQYPGRIDVAALAVEYCEKPGLISRFPGALECLEALRQAGHTMVSVTNGYRCYQEPVLRQLGILPYFAAVITPEAVGATKPEAAIFRAAERYGAPRVHVGDALAQDVVGARAVGWKSIFVMQPGAAGATPLPQGLEELAPWERKLSPEWIRERLQRELQAFGHDLPPTESCTPDAVVCHLDEIPATVAWLLA